MSLWKDILSSVSRGQKRSDSVIYFLGDRSSGKRSLVRAMKTKEKERDAKTSSIDSGAELGFTYIDALHPSDSKDKKGDGKRREFVEMSPPPLVQTHSSLS
jgi:hypothetical protein